MREASLRSEGHRVKMYVNVRAHVSNIKLRVLVSERNWMRLHFVDRRRRTSVCLSFLLGWDSRGREYHLGSRAHLAVSSSQRSVIHGTQAGNAAGR